MKLTTLIMSQKILTNHGKKSYHPKSGIPKIDETLNVHPLQQKVSLYAKWFN
jgi:hypothetical protein